MSQVVRQDFTWILWLRSEVLEDVLVSAVCSSPLSFIQLPDHRSKTLNAGNLDSSESRTIAFVVDSPIASAFLPVFDIAGVELNRAFDQEA